VLFDIQMAGLDGFEVLRAVRGAAPLPLVIFVTGYDEHALRAFQAQALAYLLKPVEQESGCQRATGEGAADVDSGHLRARNRQPRAVSSAADGARSEPAFLSALAARRARSSMLQEGFGQADARSG
jgi:DNA-binding LytR/AlgR family response regulator